MRTSNLVEKVINVKFWACIFEYVLIIENFRKIEIFYESEKTE